MDSAAAPARTIELTIVHGTNKTLEVSTVESIDAMKVAAMALFGIAETEKGSFILRAKIRGDEDDQLDESKTVEDYHLHHGQKVVLASGTPFGSWNS